MRVLLASEPGAAERPNADFAAALPGVVVLLLLRRAGGPSAITDTQ